jgi:hypothetical protein
MDLIPYGEAHFYRANLIDVKVIMPIMCVSVVEFLYQVVTRQILILKYLLSGTHGCLWSCPVVPSIKCRRFPRSWLLWCFTRY